MTLCISGTDRKKHTKTVCVYSAVSALCIAVNYIYSQFSHGVRSVYMQRMYLIPLISGALLFLAMAVFRIPALPRVSYNLHNSAVAAVTTGIFVYGICEIAGTTASFQKVYFAAAAAMETAAAVYCILYNVKKKHMTTK